MSKNRSTSTILSIFIAFFSAIVAAITTYILAVRPRHLRWGATDEEMDCKLPGDELISNPRLRATHAVSVETSPNKIWPWLVQLGQGRGGFYSYDWIENLVGLEIQSADRILPDHQTLEVGDVIPLAADGFGIPVAMIEPERALVLYGDTRKPGPGSPPVLKPGDYFTVTWGFYLLENSDGTTRLIERWQSDWNPTFYNNAFYRVFLEPATFIMERKMLLSIKDRAESLEQMEK
jgi:hypothetical protein